MLLVVVAIVLLIAAKNWKAVAPTALEIHKKATGRGPATTATEPESYELESTSSPSSSGDAWNPTPPSRPSLGTMEQRTSAHTSAVNEALKDAP